MVLNKDLVLYWVSRRTSCTCIFLRWTIWENMVFGNSEDYNTGQQSTVQHLELVTRRINVLILHNIVSTVLVGSQVHINPWHLCNTVLRSYSVLCIIRGLGGAVNTRFTRAMKLPLSLCLVTLHLATANSDYTFQMPVMGASQCLNAQTIGDFSWSRGVYTIFSASQCWLRVIPKTPAK